MLLMFSPISNLRQGFASQLKLYIHRLEFMNKITTINYVYIN